MQWWAGKILFLSQNLQKRQNCFELCNVWHQFFSMVNLLIISDVLNTHIIWLWPLETFLWPFEKTFLRKKRVFLNILETPKSASEGAWNLKSDQSRIFATTKSERSIFWPSRFLFSKDMILMQLWKTHIALLWHLQSFFFDVEGHTLSHENSLFSAYVRRIYVFRWYKIKRFLGWLSWLPPAWKSFL